MRHYLPLLIACLAFLSLTECQKENNQVSGNNAESYTYTQKEIRFIGQWLNEGKREQLVRDFVRKYEFEHQDVRVKLKFPEEIYYDRADINSNQKFIVQIMTQPNPEWDIIRINNQFKEVITLCKDPEWAKKYLVDFSEIPEFRQNTMPQLLTEAKKAEWGGIIPGPYIEGQYWALWSNTKVAQKVGIEIKQYGMTFDDFVGYIKAINVYNQSHPNDYITPIHEASDWQTTFTIFNHLYVSALTDKTDQFTYTMTEQKREAYEKTMKALEELSHYNLFSQTWQNTSWNDSKFDLIDEKCLFYLNGSWMYNIWEGKDPVKTTNCVPNEFPVFNETNSYPGGYMVMWGVLKNSPNRDQAIKFLLELNSPDIAEMWVQYTKCPTGIKGKLTDVTFSSDRFEQFTNHVQSKYGANLYPQGENNAQYITGIPNDLMIYYREVLLGQMSADEAITMLKKKKR